MKAGFIGAGKVGFSLGKHLSNGGMILTGYYSLSDKSAREAAVFTGSKCYTDLSGIVSDSDTLFVTVPDAEIGRVWEQIRDLPIKNKNICHCSGSIPSTVFFDAEERGAFRYSVHPLYAVSDKYSSYKDLGEAVFAVEGSIENLQAISAVISKAGNRAVSIDTDSKSLYHCAAVTVSNHVAALAEIGVGMLCRCGFSREDAARALAPLIEGNARAISSIGVERALTGPVERNDVKTVRTHMDILEGEMRDVYRALSGVLVNVAERKHPERDYEDMKKELRK